MEDIGRLVWLLPPLSQMGLDREGAWSHVCTDFIPYQRAVSEAQRRIGLEVEGEMRVKVRRIIATYTQNATALGLPRFHAPQHGRTGQRPDGQRYASYQARLEQITTTHARGLLGMLYGHRHPPLRWAPQAVRSITVLLSVARVRVGGSHVHQ